MTAQFDPTYGKWDEPENAETAFLKLTSSST